MVLFEWVGMSLVGPLSNSTCGHEYILVIVDYATRYPEAIPLCNAMSKNMGLWSSSAKLESQNTCSLIKAAAGETSENLGLPLPNICVKRFNQTQKRMLQPVIDKEVFNWDLLSPCVLFYQFHPFRALIQVEA